MKTKQEHLCKSKTIRDAQPIFSEKEDDNTQSIVWYK